MNRKIKILIFLAVMVFCMSMQPVVDELRAEPSQQENSQISPFGSSDESIPEWLKRTNFAVAVESDQKPNYFLETIQPLFGTQYNDAVFFNQNRISSKNGRPTYNMGFGLRKIVNDRYLLGINSFYDYQDLHKHSRGGVGFDVMNDKGLEARMNAYIRISSKRLIREDAIYGYYEEVANGFDYELGMPVPFMPSLKVYGGGNWYDFDHFKNKYGWNGRLEFTPAKYSRINFEVFDDTKRDKMGCKLEGAISLAFTSFAISDIVKDIKGSATALPKIDLKEHKLDRVVRDFNITVIETKKNKTTGLTVEGGRT